MFVCENFRGQTEKILEYLKKEFGKVGLELNIFIKIRL